MPNKSRRVEIPIGQVPTPQELLWDDLYMTSEDEDAEFYPQEVVIR